MRIFITIILSLLFFNANAQVKSEKTDLESMELKGKVKWVREYSYLAVMKDSIVSKGERKRGSNYDNDFTVIFNENGNIVEKRWCNPDEVFLPKILKTYNPNGKITEEKFLKKNGNVLYINGYTYDKKNRLIEFAHNHFENSEFNFRETFEYNDQGNQSSHYSYDQHDSLNHKSTFSYNTDGKIIEEVSSRAYGDLIMIHRYLYNSNGELIEECTFDSKEILSKKTTYLYNNGNRVEKKRFKYPEGRLEIKVTYSYYENGQIKESVFEDSGNKLYLKQVCKFDEKGNMLSIDDYSTDGKVYNKCSYHYEYDEQNNWLKRIKFEYSKPTYILERKIEYFD